MPGRAPYHGRDGRGVRLVLADDHELVRVGVRSLLASVRGVKVVGETGSGREAVALAAKLKPDLVLMDVTMPDLNGIEAAARIVADTPQVRVVVLSMSTDEQQIARALRAGVSGYVLKASAPQEIELAIRAAMTGGIFLSPAVSRRVVEEYLQRKADGLPPLTRRQIDVLQQIAEGKSTKAIAMALHISVKTVETHRAQLMRRLGVRDVASLVRYALRTGLVSGDD